jgi:hypothetical protein
MYIRVVQVVKCPAAKTDLYVQGGHSTPPPDHMIPKYRACTPPHPCDEGPEKNKKNTVAASQLEKRAN